MQNIFCTAALVDGDWTAWVDQGTCSASCGGGTQTQARTCTNPEPSGSGQDCVGDLTRDVDCNTDVCPPGIVLF